MATLKSKVEALLSKKSKQLIVFSMPYIRFIEETRGYKRAGLIEDCNRKQKKKKRMKFTRSIVATAAVCSLTQAVNVQRMSDSDYVYTPSEHVKAALIEDELNSQAIS